MGAGRDLVGAVLQGTYRVERLIGEGGMGAVYEAAHLRLARRFAVKLLFASVSHHPEALARFQREALITSALGHPHILEVIDFNHTDHGAAYIVMELLDGEDLALRISRAGRLELPQASSVLRQASSALHAAHSKGIIHRDLKPQNIFLCNRGERDDFVKIVDFGISKVLGSQSVVTKTQALMGTPAYMSPEQAQEGAAQVDLRTDVYALGVIAFEMLAGRPPFAASSVPTLLYKIVHEQPPLLRSLAPHVPEDVEDVVHRALAKDLAERYASMTALWEDFSRAIQKARVEFTEPTEDRQTLWTAEIVPAPRRSDEDRAEDGEDDEDGERAGALSQTMPSYRGAAAASTRDRPAADSARITTLSASAGERVAARTPPRARTRQLLVGAAAAAALAIGGGAVGLHLGGGAPNEPSHAASATPQGLVAPPSTDDIAAAPGPGADLQAAVSRADASVDARANDSATADETDAAATATGRKSRPRRRRPRRKRDRQPAVNIETQLKTTR